jgi:hypothetical protein
MQGQIQDLEKEGGAGRFTLKFMVNLNDFSNLKKRVSNAI